MTSSLHLFVDPSTGDIVHDTVLEEERYKVRLVVHRTAQVIITHRRRNPVNSCLRALPMERMHLRTSRLEESGDLLFCL